MTLLGLLQSTCRGMLPGDSEMSPVWFSVLSPPPSIENESIAEQDDDDLTKVATGTSPITHTQAQKRERRKADLKVETLFVRAV